MLVIGIIGGVASGKSRVADAFGQLGARVIRADEVGHEVLREPGVEQSLRARWGEAVFDAGGRIDRAAVARRVFSDSPAGEEDRRYLESVTHPRIAEAMRAQLREWEQQGDVPAAVLDAAVLLEAGWHQMCDKLVFVDASRDVRVKRAGQRGWSVTEVEARESAQLSLEEKRKVADWVIDNSGSMDHTFAQVKQFWQSLDLVPPNLPFP
jgi:dephospho-CoA kinase